MATKDEVKASAKALFTHCESLMDDGAAEYAAGSDNGFQNFERIGEELGLDREEILVVYARKHWDGIISWIRGHTSQRESVHGRIQDLIVYLALLNAMIEEGEGL